MITGILKDYSDSPFGKIISVIWFLITVIRSFPFAEGLKIKFPKETDCFQLVTENTYYKVEKAS